MNSIRSSPIPRLIARCATRTIPVALLLALTGFPRSALAAPGDLDPTFGGAGYVITALGSGDDTADAVVIQGDGKIIGAGASFNGAEMDFAAARYTAEGTLDAAFAGDGILTTDFGAGDDRAYDATLQPDGKLILAGYAYSEGGHRFALARYEPNGDLDPTFDGDGRLIIPFDTEDGAAAAVAVQSDGKIVIAGTVSTGDDFDIALARVLPNGELDSTFSGDGRTITPIAEGWERASDLVIQPDGKIVVAGEDRTGGDGTPPHFVVLRYNGNGSLDESFGTGGIAITAVGDEAIAHAVALQQDGKIVVAGRITQASYDYFGIARYTAAGSLDVEGFGDGGYVMISPGYGGFANDVVIQPDGWIVAAGGGDFGSGYDDFTLMRLNWLGGMDDEFGAGGIAHSSLVAGADAAIGLALQADGKIVAAGSAGNGSNDDFAVARFLGAAGPPPAEPVLARYAFGGGGGETSGPSLVVRGSIAQDSAIGQTSGASLVLRAGFWHASGKADRTASSATVTPEEGGYLLSPDGRTAIAFPIGSVNTSVIVTFTQQLAPFGTLQAPDEAQPRAANAGGNLVFAGNAFHLAAADDQGNPVPAFLQPYVLALDYADGDWQEAGITDEGTLNLYWWDPNSGQWTGLLPCAGCSLDLNANRLTMQFDRVGDFALYGETISGVYLPVILR
jgi:uncharacterized delta-60 repeat protein